MTYLWRCYHKLIKEQLHTTADKWEIKDFPRFAFRRTSFARNKLTEMGQLRVVTHFKSSPEIGDMSGYYDDKLSAKRLKRCYEIAPPRVRQYLEAEVNYVLQKIRPGDLILELGCGYGRIFPRLTQKARWVIGIDTSLASLLLGQKMLSDISNYHLLNMNAVQLAFRDQIFDLVICIQNGISAFHVNQQELIQESIRVTKSGGTVLFSSYSDRFWQDRLQWFQLQSEAGLLGEIDREKTHDGVIVCKDGFTATTMQPHQFLSLTAEFNVDTRIVEVDESSLFCEIIPPQTEICSGE